ncbi:unnamed protein product, partial [Notodromas monacha]
CPSAAVLRRSNVWAADKAFLEAAMPNLESESASFRTPRQVLNAQMVHLRGRNIVNQCEVFESARLRPMLKMNRCLNSCFLLAALFGVVSGGDMMRKSIVFSEETPDVFYCPQEKPTTVDNMFVKARPLDKLCEFHGKRLPRKYRSDCYNDVDESEFACMEKERINRRMTSLNETGELTNAVRR